MLTTNYKPFIQAPYIHFNRIKCMDSHFRKPLQRLTWLRASTNADMHFQMSFESGESHNTTLAVAGCSPVKVDDHVLQGVQFLGG
jgi:hypothetical protein